MSDPTPREVLAAALHEYFLDEHDLPDNVAPQCERAAVVVEAHLLEDGHIVVPMGQSSASLDVDVLARAEEWVFGKEPGTMYGSASMLADKYEIVARLARDAAT